MKAFSALVLLALRWPTTAWASSSGCLCSYSQSCWPSASTFSRLQSLVSQPLIYPLPSASGCYPPSDPSGNCTAVYANWTDGNWRSSIPGAMEAPNFETFTFQNGTIDACYLNTTITGICEQGSVPVLGVDARSVEDIQAAVTFAVQQNLKLVVKNTGWVISLMNVWDMHGLMSRKATTILGVVRRGVHLWYGLTI